MRPPPTEVTAPAAAARSGVLSRLADALARASARFVPDAFSIACVLTFVTLGSPRLDVALTDFLALVLCWLNWGMGLIASAVLVGTVARRHPDVDYRLLVAVAYLGMGATFHGGLSAWVHSADGTP